jgi:hypothetical protein
VVVAQEQLLRMQEAWRESVEKDVICLREVLGQYKERLERLEMQKQLLLSQVLKLEFSLEEEETKVDTLQAQLQTTLRERDTARAAAASAVNMAAAATGGPCGAAGAIAAASNAGCEGADPSGAPTTPQGPGTLHVALPPINTAAAAGIFDACSDDGWASTPTVDTLLPKIVALWDELYVPLVYRSRFFLCFRGREVFYYEVEARRLEWKRSQMLQGAIDEPSMQLGRGSFGLDGNNTPKARGPTGPNGTPRPLSAAAAAGLTASSSSFGGMRRRSKELDKAARWVCAGCKRQRGTVYNRIPLGSSHDRLHASTSILSGLRVWDLTQRMYTDRCLRAQIVRVVLPYMFAHLMHPCAAAVPAGRWTGSARASRLGSSGT